MVSQVNPEPLNWFKHRYGGLILRRKLSGKNPKHRDVHTWEIHSAAAVRVLDELLPHLIVKRDEAFLALRFNNEIASVGRGVKKTSDVIGLCESFRTQLSIMKKSVFPLSEVQI